MLPPEQRKRFNAFYDSVRNESELDRETTILVGLAAAMAAGCDPWMEHYLGVARENGLSEKQIGAVQGIVMAVCAGKVNATFRAVEQRCKEG